jgi:hypothetical protein
VKQLKGLGAHERRWKIGNKWKEMDQALRERRCEKIRVHNMGLGACFSKKTTTGSRAPTMQSLTIHALQQDHLKHKTITRSSQN